MTYQQTTSARAWRERREFMPAILEWVQKARPHSVMVDGYELRHLRVFFDAGKPYVLLSRGSSRHRKYLSDMAGARKIIGTETPIFYEWN